jgi:hypothetical protein
MATIVSCLSITGKVDQGSRCCKKAFKLLLIEVMLLLDVFGNGIMSLDQELRRARKHLVE